MSASVRVRRDSPLVLGRLRRLRSDSPIAKRARIAAGRSGDSGWLRPAVSLLLELLPEAFQTAHDGPDRRELLAAWRTLKALHGMLEGLTTPARITAENSKLLKAHRETYARSTVELLRFHAIKHDPKTLVPLQPLEWNPEFGPEQFADAAPELARPLDDAIHARTGRALVPRGRTRLRYDSRSEPEIWEKLAKTFRRWILAVRWPDRASDDDFERLACAMFRALGAPSGAVKNAFRVAYHRETMADRRAAPRTEAGAG